MNAKFSLLLERCGLSLMAERPVRTNRRKRVAGAVGRAVERLESVCLLSSTANTVVFNHADQVVAVYQNALEAAPPIAITVNGGSPVSGDQVRISHAVVLGSADVREIFVIDTNGYLRAVHLDPSQPAGRQDPFGGSVVLGPTMILNSGSQGGDFALRPQINTLDIVTPTTPHGDIVLKLTGTSASSSGPVPGLTVSWTLTIPNTTPTPGVPQPDITTVLIQQAAHFSNAVTLSPSHQANAEGFRVARFSNSYVDATQTTLGTTTHDADVAQALGADGALLKELDLEIVPRGALLVPGGVAGATELQLQQRAPALLNDDPPNMRLRIINPADPTQYRAQGFLSNDPSVDENSDNLDWYLNQQFATSTIAAGTDLNWQFELTASDGSDLLPQVQFLHNQAEQYSVSANPSDFGQPMVPIFTNGGDGGVYLQDIFNGGVTDSGSDPDAFLGRSSYRMTLTQLGQNGFAVFKLGSQRPPDIADFGLARNLRFAAKGDAAGQQLEVKVQKPDGSFLNLGSAGLITLTTGWNEIEIVLPAGVKPSDVDAIHFVLNPINPQGQGTVRLDEIRLGTDGTDPLRVLQSYVPQAASGNARDDGVLARSAFLYDNSLAIKALLLAGDSSSVTLARNIAAAILKTQQLDGSFFDELTSGHVSNVSGVRNATGERRLGDNMFFGLALLELARQFPAETTYYDAAQKLSDWVANKLTAGGPLGGFHGGLSDLKLLLMYRSTEHNLDAFEFHRQLTLAADQRGHSAPAATYRQRATRAGEFVVSMFDKADGFFRVGTRAGSDDINTDSVPADVQYWALQTLGQSIEFGQRVDYSRAIVWADTHLAVSDGSLKGVGFSSGSVAASPGHVWLEGTAHAAVSDALLGISRAADLEQRLATLRQARLFGAADAGSTHDGFGVPASSRDGLVDPAFPLVAFDDRLHVGATVWTYFAEAGRSPFQPLQAGPVTPPQLVLGGSDVSWVKKQKQVMILPLLTVANTNWGGGTLTLRVDAVGTGKRATDTFKIPSFTSLGNGPKAAFANGQLTLQIQLKPKVTAAAIQAFLRKITFSTKGAGLEVATRTFEVTLKGTGGLSGSVSQTIHVGNP